MIGVVHQIADADRRCPRRARRAVELIRVDGGLGRNDSVLQAIADLAGMRLSARP